MTPSRVAPPATSEVNLERAVKLDIVGHHREKAAQERKLSAFAHELAGLGARHRVEIEMHRGEVGGEADRLVEGEPGAPRQEVGAAIRIAGRDLDLSSAIEEKSHTTFAVMTSGRNSPSASLRPLTRAGSILTFPLTALPSSPPSKL